MRLLPPLVAGAVLICLVAHDATAGAGQDKWWQDPVIQRELALTADQVRTLDRLFASTHAEQRRLGKALAELEKSLQHAMATADVDDVNLARAVDELEAVRARRNTTRTLMLFRMYRTLTPAQRQRLRTIQKGSERPRRAAEAPASPF